MCPGDSRARDLAPTEGAPLSRIRTSLHAYPKLLLTLTAAGSAVTAAVITLSGASAGQLASGQPAAAQHAAHPAAAAAGAPATFRPIATLDAAATSQRVTARRTAQKMLAHYGWGKRQWTPLDKLWNRESGWNKYAQNPYSGAYGIPQAVPGSKMASAGRHWRSNATTQIRWGLGYIKSRYGRPRAAWDHELAYGWY
jgi:hypothetical protein